MAGGRTKGRKPKTLPQKSVNCRHFSGIYVTASAERRQHENLINVNAKEDESRLPKPLANNFSEKIYMFGIVEHTQEGEGEKSE